MPEGFLEPLETDENGMLIVPGEFRNEWGEYLGEEEIDDEYDGFTLDGEGDPPDEEVS